MDFDTYFSGILAALPIAAAIGCSVFIVLYSSGMRDGAAMYGIITAAVFFVFLPVRKRRPERRRKRRKGTRTKI
jgi:hypothetical protein